MAENIVVAVFPSRKTLVRALDHLTDNPIVDIKRAAVVAKASSGETVFVDDDLSADEGGIAGGAFGALVGVLGFVSMGALALPGVGPVVALGAGVVIGGFAGHITGRVTAGLLKGGLRDELLATVTNSLEAGHPALLLQVDDAVKALDILRDALKPFRVETIESIHTTALNPPANLA